MSRIRKNIDIDNAIDQMIISKIQLTKNEYTASVRNQVEYNRLKIIKRHINDQNDTSKYRIRTSIHDLRQQLDDNQRVIGNVDEYVTNREAVEELFEIRMATPSFDLLIVGQQRIARAAGSSTTQKALIKARLRLVHQVFNDRRLVYQNRVETNRKNILLSSIENSHQREQSSQRLQKHQILKELKGRKTIVDSDFVLRPFSQPKDLYRFGVRVQSAIPQFRSRAVGTASSRRKSLSTFSRPVTAPAQTFFTEDFLVDSDEIESIHDDTSIPTASQSRITSATRPSTARARSSAPRQSSSELVFDQLTPSNQRITWPVRIKVFSLQDEDEARQKFLEWTADQRRMRSKRSSKQNVDFELEQKYHQSVRRRKEIESFVTPEIIEEHQLNDPVFAKRYRQLQLAIRAGKCPVYDANDREIHFTINKSSVERTRTALIAAKENRMKDFYRNQQRINDAKLSKRVEHFLKRLAQFQKEQNPDNND